MESDVAVRDRRLRRESALAFEATAGRGRWMDAPVAERILSLVLLQDEVAPESTAVDTSAYDPSAVGERKDRCPTSTSWKHAKGGFSRSRALAREHIDWPPWRS